jgi:UDP-N-acetylmuramate dehydrogenase
MKQPSPIEPAAVDSAAEIHSAVSLAAECRFGVGGPADYFARVSGPNELGAALRFASDNALGCFVYSGGSNLFFADAGFRGLVLRIQGGSWTAAVRHVMPTIYSTRERSSAKPGQFSPARLPDLPVGGAEVPVVEVAAGYDLPALVRELAAESLGGIEFLGNIPGSLGGAVVGNAGCYGRAIAEVLVNATVLDTAGSEVQVVGPEFFEFEYRHSRLKDDSRYLCVAATLRLTERPAVEVLQEVEGELELRLSKHPHFAACAGSFFKNPESSPAWCSIEGAGLAEARIGGALLHPKHANFLVNDGCASAADVLALARLTRQRVLEHAGIVLEPEVRYVGEHGIEAI